MDADDAHKTATDERWIINKIHTCHHRIHVIDERLHDARYHRYIAKCQIKHKFWWRGTHSKGYRAQYIHYCDEYMPVYRWRTINSWQIHMRNLHVTLALALPKLIATEYENCCRWQRETNISKQDDFTCEPAESFAYSVISASWYRVLMVNVGEEIQHWHHLTQFGQPSVLDSCL